MKRSLVISLVATVAITIIVFAADKSYWTPQSRRIASARPGTDGSYTFALPSGDYRITAVVDVEQGEWFDPDFLKQLLPASIPVSIAEGETKTQDLKLAGGGQLPGAARAPRPRRRK